MREAHEKAIRFLEGQAGAVIKVPRGKSRITIRLDEDLLEWFRKQVDDAGIGSYQNLINRVARVRRAVAGAAGSHLAKSCAGRTAAGELMLGGGITTAR